VAQARRGIESASPALVERALDGLIYWAKSWDTPARLPPATFLVPNYDEYLIAYKDRHLVRPPAGIDVASIFQGADAYAHPLVVDGIVAGVWRRRVSGAKTAVEIVPKMPLTAPQRRAVSAAADRLAAFSGPRLTVAWRRS
jgi:hypothetical protein